MSVKSCEIGLMALFSMIRVGADDPLPWLPVVDHVLRQMWHALPQEKRELAFVKNLFDELTLFAHGTALNAFVIRCPKKSCSSEVILVSDTVDTHVPQLTSVCRTNGTLSSASTNPVAPIRTAARFCRTRQASVPLPCVACSRSAHGRLVSACERYGRWCLRTGTMRTTACTRSPLAGRKYTPMTVLQTGC